MSDLNPRRVQRDISEISNPTRRAHHARELIPRVEDGVAELESRVARYKAAWDALSAHVGNVSPDIFKIAALKRWAVILVVLDMIAQALLNAVAFPNTATWKILTGSIAIALVVTGFTHLLLIYVVHDTDRAPRTRRLARRLTTMAVVAIILAASFFLFYRQAGSTMAGALFGLTGVFLWIVAESLPVVAGSFSADVYVLEEPVRAGRKLRAEQAALGRQRDLLAFLQAESQPKPESGGDGGGSRSKYQRPSTGGTGVTLALVVLCLAVVSTPRMSSAQQGTRGAPQCGLFLDGTPSLEPEARRDAVRLTVERMPTVLMDAGCRGVLTGTFADEGAWAPRRWLAVPSKIATMASCDSAQLARPTGKASLFRDTRGMRVYLQEEAKRSCLDQIHSDRSAFETARDALGEGLRQALEAPPVDVATHTDIEGLVQGMWASQVSLLIVVTDGQQTSPVMGILQIVPDGRRLVLLLVPAQPRYGGRDATLQAGEVWRARGAAVFPYLVLQSPTPWKVLGGDRR